MKKSFAALLALILAVSPCVAFPALSGSDIGDHYLGQRLENLHAAYITEEGFPSETDFFTDECFSENRITVINFWDSGCMNCRIEMPDFELAYQNYRDMGVGFLGVATRWIGGPYEQCITVLNDCGVTYPNVFIDDAMTRFTEEYHHCPQTLIADENGVILYFRSGRMEYSELEEAICAFLATPGDVDSDGSVSFADVSTLIAYIMNSGSLSPLGLAAADMNADGVIDILDAPAIYSEAFSH